jgi:hypothetical protein
LRAAVAARDLPGPPASRIVQSTRFVLVLAVTLALPILVRFRGAVRYLCLVVNKPPASTAPAAAASLLCWSVVIAVI